MSTPTPNHHEASRAAFEAAHSDFLHKLDIDGLYENWDEFMSWQSWKAALDHADAQVCGWTHDTTNEEYDTDCARSFKAVVYGWDCVPGFCPGCGRRVKIQPETL